MTLSSVLRSEIAPAGGVVCGAELAELGHGSDGWSRLRYWLRREGLKR